MRRWSNFTQNFQRTKLTRGCGTYEQKSKDYGGYDGVHSGKYAKKAEIKGKIVK